MRTITERVSAQTRQGRLFGARGVETFACDENTGMITRIVVPRDVAATPVTTEIGYRNTTSPTDDLRALADLAYLQRGTPPPTSENGERIRVADLFSGVGCMSLGVAEACRALGKRFVPVAAFDTNTSAVKVYNRNFGEGIGRVSDLSQLLSGDLDAPPTEAEKLLKDELGSVDMVVAGPPCQGHSNLNNRTRRRDPKNALYILVARFAQLFKPRWVLVENVIAVRHDSAKVVERTSDALTDLGYEVDEDFVDLLALGVPQTRRRHILAAQLHYVRGGHRRLPFVADLIAPHATKPRAVRWAIGDLLDVPPVRAWDIPKTPDAITQARIDYLFDNDVHDLPDSQRPDCHKQGHTYGAVYGRMRWDDPAPTITGGFDTMGRGRFVHPKRRRTITAHEAARIQFIPDFFDFRDMEAHRGHLVEAIGNAVPPKLSYSLALELIR